MSINEVAFQAIKKTFSTASFLQHFDSDKECTVKPDTLDYVSAIGLFQPDYEGIL